MPLCSDPRVGETAKQIEQGAPIARIRTLLVGCRGNEHVSVLRQFRVRQSGALVMHAVIRLVKQAKSQQPAGPALGDNAAGRAFHSAAGQPDVFDIFAQTLEIRGEIRRYEIHPQEIFPDVEPRDRHQNENPDKTDQRELSPNPAPHLFAPNRRTCPKKAPQEYERREKQTCAQLKDGGENSLPARRSGNHEWPEFFIPFCGQIGVMGLMGSSIQAETHETKDSQDNSIYLIQALIRPQMAVGRLVKSYQQPMHEMAAEQHQEDREPVRTLVQSPPERELCEEKYDRQDAEGPTAQPMRLFRFDEIFRIYCSVHYTQGIMTAVRLSGERQAPASEARKLASSS
jgi:hypothetical protein